MKKQKISNINDIEESGGPNFIYDDEDTRQENIYNKWNDLAKRFVNLINLHNEYLFSLHQISTWEKQHKLNLLKLQECCALRGHGQIESDRQPHERITHECLFCGKSI